MTSAIGLRSSRMPRRCLLDVCACSYSRVLPPSTLKLQNVADMLADKLRT